MKAFKIALPLMFLLAITACNESNNAKNSTVDTNTASQSQKNTVTQAEKAKLGEYVSPLPENAPVYNAGVVLHSPYHFSDEFGKSVGFDVDLLRAIGEEEGFKVTFNQMEFKKVFTSIEEGKMDIVLSGLSLTPERQEKYAMSQPYTHGKAGYMLKTDAPYNSKEELNDKRIGVITGSNLAKMVDSETKAMTVEKPTLFLAFQTIFTDESDAVFGFEPNLTYESQQFTDYSFKFVPFSENVPTVMYANKNNQEMIDKVNAGLDKIQANGKYQKISEKWFGNKASTFTVE